MIKLVCLEPSRGEAYKKAVACLERVGQKCGYYSWYVEAKKVPVRLLKKVKAVTVINLDGRITMKSLKASYKEDR